METKVKAMQYVYAMVGMIDERRDPVLIDVETSPAGGGLAAKSPAGLWTALS